MDEQKKKEIIQIIEYHNQVLAFALRDKSFIVPTKIRSTVFLEDVPAMFESELKIDDIEKYEENYQKYLKHQVLEDAKRIHKE